MRPEALLRWEEKARSVPRDIKKEKKQEKEENVAAEAIEINSSNYL